MSEEIPIGPNPCHGCGGEYGEHDPDCMYVVRTSTTNNPERWEFLYIYGEAFEIIDRLNRNGEKGWQLVAVIPDSDGKHVAYMKRLKQSRH